MLRLTVVTVAPEAAQEAVLNVCLLNTSLPWAGLEEGKLMARLEGEEMVRMRNTVRTLALILLDCSAPSLSQPVIPTATLQSVWDLLIAGFSRVAAGGDNSTMRR